MDAPSGETADGHNRGSWTSELCQFSYARFHLYLTIPPTVFLYLLNRPFLTRLDRAKLIFLPVIAFVWTTPWDNELVRQRAWRYPRSCVMGTVGYVPIEEYFFFIIQSVKTTLFASFMTRWLLPTFYVFETRAEKQSSLFARWSFVAVSCCFTALLAGLAMTRPGQHTYYLGMILWWCSLPLALLGWGSSNFVARMPWRAGKGAFLITLLLPTAYLWATDIFALRRGTWHINEATSLNIFPIPDLPIEEMIFFFVTNLLLVVASFTFDRCITLARLGVGVSRRERADSSTPPFSPSYLPLNLETIKALWGTFVVMDPPAEDTTGGYDGLSAQCRDLATSLDILSNASKSFSMASLLLPWDLRSDLSVLYAFCRAADDCIDDEESVPESESDHGNAKIRRIALLKDLIAAIYKPNSTESQARAAIRDTLRRFTDQESKGKGTNDLKCQSQEQLRASASSVVPLRNLVPRSLWKELLRGYEKDMHLDMKGIGTALESMEDVVEYAQCVAGCIGEMCVRVVLGRCGVIVPSLEDLNLKRTIDLDKETLEPLAEDDVSLLQRPEGSTSSASRATARYLIHHARRMGVSLQLVNIARDVVDDSIKLRRCYLPRELIERNEPAQPVLEALFAGKVSSDAKGSKDTISPASLRPYCLQLLKIASSLYTASFPSIQALSSKPTQSGLRAACAVYFAISQSILEQSEEEIRAGKRARMSKWRRAYIATKAVYLGRG
ncbi:hypothetical protein BCV69DRAFT_251316 [Microstroma glucosiphilum]|uniref:Bifunctional lycopene cyclase/phytoene synthase n=1 Tax=Pseudomicrostroma glucosiphilum TaxID=1684307 RepID=A0A316U1J9_9BASI|nr:hypothetical protein BCV69DRAFT_251316 [Pseudomicrostroma glucosiphilum]PWN19252.1 hypothetical protein BCV69DRAFT_251316 [Pseudomicrostroma glucosiphilum]